MTSVARLRSVVLDCPDPAALAAFYAALAGGTPDAQDDDWVVLHVPDGPRLCFQRSEAYEPPKWPGPEGAQQFHLDFDGGPTWADIDRAHEQVLALGARPLDLTDRETKDFQVYADPAGHPFCLCRIEEG
ncbi:VOC family protein [Streptomyces sp. J2-1]|uniref:VOC family protein n=1 Tax=Streptomyces corallincola TaxID=2851888 RepID=UPI001C384722|nr:VOC family protein [Streptomyces corallincola]MBV2356111.1 VOC family protein [Streptomyces corallincola]